MNNKINELSEKCDMRWNWQEDIKYTTITSDQLNKFSELLVRDIIMTISRQYPNSSVPQILFNIQNQFEDK